MTLADYLKKEKLTFNKFSEISGLSAALLFKVAKCGKTNTAIRLVSALKIQSATNGKVGFTDLIGPMSKVLKKVKK